MMRHEATNDRYYHHPAPIIVTSSWSVGFPVSRIPTIILMTGLFYNYAILLTIVKLYRTMVKILLRDMNSYNLAIPY